MDGAVPLKLMVCRFSMTLSPLNLNCKVTVAGVNVSLAQFPLTRWGWEGSLNAVAVKVTPGKTSSWVALVKLTSTAVYVWPPIVGWYTDPKPMGPGVPQGFWFVLV